jgi:DNA-binding beta-propeller fold protein YncE
MQSRRLINSWWEALVLSLALAVVPTPSMAPVSAQSAGYEVWLMDQQDTRPDGGGTLYVYSGAQLEANPATATPTAIDLGGALRDLCMAKTNSAPRRPHMVVFNGGYDQTAAGNTHAIVSFVATGHVAFIDAASRNPVDCIDVGAQAHAAWPTPDQKWVVVANQNGKLFQRISTNYASNAYALDDSGTINLATCTTPSGAPCEDANLRPDNAPICPVTDRAGKLSFVTLRGGGMFVVDHNATPMKIVAEYDRSVVRDNGCGLAEVGGKMFFNSGSGAPLLSHTHDVYVTNLADFATPSTTPNSPAVTTVYTRENQGEVDSHGVLLSKDGGYLWVADRVKNDVNVVDTKTNLVVSWFTLGGGVSGDPAPDILDLSPSGALAFAALRGPSPATGGHDATGGTPGLGIIKVIEGGWSGKLVNVLPVPDVMTSADPHGVRVRHAVGN